MRRHTACVIHLQSYFISPAELPATKCSCDRYMHMFNLTSLANYDEQITLVSHFVYFFSWLQKPYFHFLLVPWNSLIPTEEWSHDNQYVVPVFVAGWPLICRWLFITVACKKVNLQINKSRTKLLCGNHIPVQAIT